VYEKEAVRRRRAVLIGLVLASLGLLTFFFGDSVPSGLRAVQRGVQVVFSPIEEGASRALKPFRDLAGWTGDVWEAKAENDRLIGEVAHLRRDLARAETDRRDLEQLRALVRLPRRGGYPGDTNPVTARVIARSPTVWYSKVKIDKGSGDGIRNDQPVVTGDGLVGRISQVTGGSAVVTLITDDSSAVSAQVMPDGSGGVVKPETGKPEDLLLDFIQRGRKIRKGAVVVTSGSTSSDLESLFPRGIPIGRVRRVDPNEVTLYQRIHITPFADTRRMDFVQVLTQRPRSEGTEVSAR
jgi:rod shape-determining protein MreC